MHRVLFQSQEQTFHSSKHAAVQNWQLWQKTSVWYASQEACRFHILAVIQRVSRPHPVPFFGNHQLKYVHHEICWELITIWKIQRLKKITNSQKQLEMVAWACYDSELKLTIIIELTDSKSAPFFRDGAFSTAPWLRFCRFALWTPPSLFSGKIGWTPSIASQWGCIGSSAGRWAKFVLWTCGNDISPQVKLRELYDTLPTPPMC